jgi:hypothetical protein
MKFEVHGPFSVRRKRRLVSRENEDKKKFWEEVEDDEEGLSEACGCYVFAVHGRVWYVGLAAAQSFKHEMFTAHKINLYNDALQDVAGKPSLLFVAKRTPRNRFAKKSARGHRDIEMLENLLIGSALSRNPKLKNLKGTKLLREMRVPGLLNNAPGKPSPSVRAFKKALGL